jgi:hypothetical protein
MKKPNGWELSPELFFIFLFFFCLFVAILGIKKMGLFDPGKQKVKTDYSLLESKLIESSKKYINKTYDNNIEGETIILRVSHLIKNNYLNGFKDNEGNNCSGYTEVYKSSSSNIIYEPYINCIEYQTSGYNANKDW